MDNDRRETFTFINLNGKKYKIEKFTALTGGFIVYKLINKALPSLFQEVPDLSALQQQMTKSEFENLVLDCLSVVSIEKKAGFFPILDQGGHLDIDFQRDTFTVMILVIHVLKFNVTDFFSKEGRESLKEALQGLNFLDALA